MYQIGHKRTTRWWGFFIIAAVVAFLLILTGGARWLFGFFSQVAAPAQDGLYQLSTELRDIKSKKELLAENAALQERLAQISLDVAQLRELEVENQVLREQLNFLEGQRHRFVTARVIARGAENALSSLVINRGQDDGVGLGYPVIAGEGVLVGRVIEASPHSATILLLSDGQSNVAATIQNTVQTIGVVSGEHGLSITMDMIPRDQVVQRNDTIITSGLQANIPRGLLIGLVDTVDASSSELFAKAAITPLVNYQTLTVVTVLTPE
ncbi:rod shape-determining protein MreC [Candidatus Falkowbacteria bacterium]|nr:rod shape-determining protein MreC [Candidatus Falkowbacteria bacterium]